MRIYLWFKGEIAERPDNIRSYFISFIKKTFQNASYQIYERIFNVKATKPYVFSPYFGEEYKKEGKIGPFISLIFSSGDFEVLANFWNGLLNLKNNRNDFLEIEKKRFFLENIKAEKGIKINSDKVIFKTIGISILTNPEENPKDFKNWYIIPEKEKIEDFNSVLNKRIEERYKYITGQEIRSNLKFEIFRDSIREIILPHYGGYVRGFKGEFILSGNKKILQFIYDYGFGVRTGQGFGLLEIVKQL